MTAASSRRRFFRTLGASAAGVALDPIGATGAPARPSSATSRDDRPVLQVGERIALAETRPGRVRGYILRGIHYYLGIPYGSPTGGANRFTAPQPPKPWTDVFPALWWGNSAPQNMDNRYANTFASFRDHWNYDDVSEDCLRLNVFTPAVGDGKKRPVLVWLHGGGFVNGNAIEQDGYNGENLARFGDVVVCSLNHRLGPLGFCNLAGAAGERLAASGNAGMLDIVAALEWVRDNIAGFGGDPGNVTIMGQSGGGAKVCTLTAMPRAKGLFHKGVVLSGASLRMGEKARSEKLGGYVLQEAGLETAEVDKLQAMPWKDEISPATFDPSLDGVTLAEVAEHVKTRAGFGAGYGDRAMEVVEAYAKAFPGRKPTEIWSLVSSTRQNVVALADAKSKQPAAVYVAWFDWQPPMLDGRMGAFHCIDICFWFHNTDLMLSHTGGGARPRKLATKTAGALVQFMKTGDPNGGGLPPWPRYSSAQGETMVLDDVSQVRNDPDREARKALPPL
jgi:para-nitrobenzyl esterase